MNGRTYAQKFRGIISLMSSMLLIFPKSFRLFLLKTFRGLKGRTGIIVRYILIKNLASQCGNNVCIMEDVYLHNVEKLCIGDNVSIHPLCYVDAIGEINIGDNVSIAHNCSLVSFNHTYHDTTSPIKYNPLVNGKITIENDVWIGCGVRILADTIIGERSIVAAGAVVNKNLPSHTISAGVPAKPVKSI